MLELIELDDFFVSILCCPLCNGPLELVQKDSCCPDCGMRYPAIGNSYDFRIVYPESCLNVQLRKWQNIQADYEAKEHRLQGQDSIKLYLDQIDSVKEIYRKEFSISGVVLDVGGGGGRLRHFLDLGDPSNQYCCIDPFVDAFQVADDSCNLVSAYPCLKEPMNFVGGFAEKLPFQSNKFDYVHLRSVLDHLSDPYIALKEAYRVLKPEGKLVLGLSVTGNKSSLDGSKLSRLRKKIRDQGLRHTGKEVCSKALRFVLKDKESNDHMLHWKYDDLADLVEAAGFAIEKVHWQKPPNDHCVYLLLQEAITAA